jgi:hypothetical protein
MHINGIDGPEEERRPGLNNLNPYQSGWDDPGELFEFEMCMRKLELALESSPGMPRKVA